MTRVHLLHHARNELVSAARPLHRIAIANRGEAAVRCIRAVKALRALEGSDLEAIALFTPAERSAPFVRHSDGAVRLEVETTAVAAYLDREGLLEACLRARADAVWPGWGFLAEDPEFADAVEAAGMVFLGPSGEVMRRLGDKIAAKQLAESVGVPVTAWSGGPVADVEAARVAAERIGYPLLVKATAGGGGRGIRFVEGAHELGAAFASAASEARNAFGDDTLFLEKKVSGGRHVEVQIAADRHGHVRSFGCRDCSVQRRHQKVIEEAPPAGLSAEILGSLERSAVALASEVGYVGVGTVEFLVAGEEVAFLEMNPRLQVEHGITEEIAGHDLVQLQVRIGRGESIADLTVGARGFAIEARVCAEDPEAGFLPAPGRIARFDPALGPRVRIDTGVATGSHVHSDFDSLIAKVIATGDDREEARARLACALRDFDLVIEGGTTNKGFLLGILDDPVYRAGGVDTGWLDRRGVAPTAAPAPTTPGEAPREAVDDLGAEALAVAAILVYQENRTAARRNFFDDPSGAITTKAPASTGQEIDLSHRGQDYRLQVRALGGWRYRVYLGDAVLRCTVREEGAHAARLLVGGRSLRILHDVSEAGLRIEIEGFTHRFDQQTAGQVRAASPSMVVAITVAPGDRVEAGHPLGVLEAMKMEIGFEAPVSGRVKEVRVRKGQQVSAGDVLVEIDPAGDGSEGELTSRRVRFVSDPDPLDALFAAGGGGASFGLEVLAQAGPVEWRTVVDSVRDDMRRVLLGYDASPRRVDALVTFLEAELDAGLPEEFLRVLAEVRHELTVFADLEQLFIRTPSASVSGEHGPSNLARLMMYVRRIRADGAGIAEEFLTLLRTALSHYDMFADKGARRTGLDFAPRLERIVLRLFASQRSSDVRRRLVMSTIRRVNALAKRGVDMGDDATLAFALSRVAGMRGLVPDAIADAAIEAGGVIFERPTIERQLARTTSRLESWLADAERDPTDPPEEVLQDLACSRRRIFSRVSRWVADPNPRRAAIAQAAYLRRIYDPAVPKVHVSQGALDLGLGSARRTDRLELPDGRMIVACAVRPDAAVEAAEQLCKQALDERAAGEEGGREIAALELLVAPGPDGGALDAEPLFDGIAALLDRSVLAAGRLTATLFGTTDGERHRTWAPAPRGEEGVGVRKVRLHGLHPETASLLDLRRFSGFDLERLPGEEGVVTFVGRSTKVPEDERVFVLGEVRERPPEGGDEAELYAPAFEHAFYEATRTLRTVLGARDPRRRLQWNRIVLVVTHPFFLDPKLVIRLTRRLAPATRHLGLEKVIVRVQLLDREAPDDPPEPVEIVISDPTGSRMQVAWREPHTAPLVPAASYERKLVAARRRGLLYPYEIIRLLTGPGGDHEDGAAAEEDRGRARLEAPVSSRVELPPGTFEEFDLEEGEVKAGKAPKVVSVADRPYGGNRAGVVFGVLTTETEKVPEGMARVLILSDPTMGMGSLSGPECDRVVAALDLAHERQLPVEWLPISSGARISMDSGTENLDATARVVRRIVRFTQEGGTIHVLVLGVNVGAQSYWDALATMLMHTRGILIMTSRASMVLTGRAALEASGGVAAEDEVGIGGYERIMGPNGQAQYFADDLGDAYRILYEHYETTYVVRGERGPRRRKTADPVERKVTEYPYPTDNGQDYGTIGEIFDDETNPGRKRPFSMRALMRALIDEDGGCLERWRQMVGAETSIVWDTHLGGHPISLIGIESQPTPRWGYRPSDGPGDWTGGTLFPQSSKKIARALNAASGNRSVVVLANLTGFDGSPESMRKLQLEYGAEIARAVVNFEGTILFLVVSRYHGGAYVVFSRALNEGVRAMALEGSYASVIGGAPAAAVVFPREVRGRTAADPRVVAARDRLRRSQRDGAAAGASAQENFDLVFAEVLLEKQAEVAAEFDAIHTVQRALDVGSLERLIEPATMRAELIGELDKAARAPLAPTRALPRIRATLPNFVLSRFKKRRTT